MKKKLLTILIIKIVCTAGIVNAQVVEPIQEFLSTPAENYLQQVPVVIIRYLPTTDGVNLNQNVTGISSSLLAMKYKIDVMDRQVKFSLEEGSKYHGYSNASAKPSLGYKVVYYVTVYENIPRSNFQVPWNPNAYRPDYAAILNRFNAQYYVEQLGVKEFWIWGYHYGDIEPAESNMSSALTGDISNSERRNDDLPIYNKSYVVYNYNYGRTQAEAVHNHGHQLEAILSYINERQTGNTSLFWEKFVGQSGGNFITGRCGWTHMPPNTTEHYEYQNYSLVQSDIEDWTPTNTGQKKYVNASTWGNINYQWPFSFVPDQQVESHWYIYWFQNMPGHGAVIKYSGLYYMTNWWKFTADWDTCITSYTGLYGLPKSLQLTSLIEGYYNNNTNTMVKDTVSVYFRNSSSPYSLADSSKRILDSLGKTTMIFWNLVSGSSYYLIVKHKNSIETWSANPVSYTPTLVGYNFSDNQTKAYGNNLKLKGTKYCIYGGDVDRDGSVDVSDMTMIDNDAFNFVSGYVRTDLNGDNYVDVDDATIADNNSFNYVMVMKP